MLGSSPARGGVEFPPFAFGVVLGSVLAVRPSGRPGPADGAGDRRSADRRRLRPVQPLHRRRLVRRDDLGPSLVSGVGIRLRLAPMASLGTSGVEEHEAGSASALLTSSRQIGAALGPAALGTVADARAGDTGTPEALADGYALGTLTGAAIAAAGVLIALAVPPSTAPDTEGAAARP